MTKEDQRYGRDKSVLVNKAYIESGEYRRKFDSVVDEIKLARVLYDVAKEMLFHRSGTQTEDMYWIDGDAGEVVAKVTDQPLDIKHKVLYTDTIKNIIQSHTNLITLHTHPSSMPPSPDDFNTYYQKRYKISLVVCHDGTIFQYESHQLISEELFGLYVKRYIEEKYDERDAQIMALTKIKKNYDIDFWEVL